MACRTGAGEEEEEEEDEEEEEEDEEDDRRPHLLVSSSLSALRRPHDEVWVMKRATDSIVLQTRGII